MEIWFESGKFYTGVAPKVYAGGVCVGKNDDGNPHFLGGSVVTDPNKREIEIRCTCGGKISYRAERYPFWCESCGKKLYALNSMGVYSLTHFLKPVKFSGRKVELTAAVREGLAATKEKK